MKKHNRRLGRLLGLSITLALPVVMLSHAPAAQAVPRVGPIKVSPATGNQSTLIDLSTLAGQDCPAGTSSIQVLMTGGILTEELPGLVNGNTDIGLVEGPSDNLAFPAGRTLGEVFAENGITNLSGTYTLRLQCLDTNLQATDEYNITTQWTAGATSGTGTYVAASTATTTSTVVNLENAGPVGAGTATVLSATVTPAEAAGTVRFRSGSTFISSPIAVAGGTATLDSYVGAAGLNNVTAVFTPTDANTYAPSTSAAKAFSVLGTPSVAGIGQVGQKLTCATPAVAPAVALPAAGKAVVWLRNGASTGITTNPVVVPASWLNASISCQVTLTRDATSVQRASAARKVTAGAALRATVRPKVVGTAKVGKVLTCSAGRWTPAATAYRYQWFRGATALKGKVARTYKTVKADKRKLVTCRVTALKTGYLSGVVKAPARKIL